MEAVRNNLVVEKQDSFSVDDDEIRDAGYGSDNDEVQSRLTKLQKSSNLGDFGGAVVVADGAECRTVAASLVAGIGRRAKVVEVRRCLDPEASVRSRARIESFRVFTEAVARKCGGDANLRYGWFGGSKEEIGEIVAHGFGRCESGGGVGGVVYGRGVYLAAAKHAIDAALGAEEDEEGVRHILMCRVILGNQEVISPGSDQSYPSSLDYDTGADCLPEARRYIIWGGYMNCYILPSYIVSFKLAPLTTQGVRGLKGENVSRGAVRPTSAWVKFSKLVALLGRVLTPYQMTQITKSYKDFCDKKIGRQQMILKLRQIAGDNLLAATIKHFRNKHDQP